MTGLTRMAVVAAAAVAVGGPAAAQEVDEVVVTGSRIQRTGMTTPTPVTSLSMDELLTIAPTTLGAAVTQLPQFVNNSVPEGAPAAGWTGASGSSILNLRGVGQNRTLVLLDGRRVVPSTRRGTLDVNLLPEPLVERMEVVTGGASAAYGSDAVSGVVNFLLDTDFTGFKASIDGGITEVSDNENYSVTLAAGTPIGERLHLIASLDYYDVQAIENPQERDWFQSWGLAPNPVSSGQPARFRAPNIRSRQFTQGGLITTPGPLFMLQFLPGGATAPFANGSIVSSTTQSGGDGVDVSMFNYLTPATQRASAFTRLSFELNDNVTTFVQALAGYNDTQYLSPPAGAQFGTWAATIFQNNAFLPEAVRQIMIDNNIASFRLGRSADLDYGASKDIEQENRMVSLTTGFKASLGEWRLDGYYQYGRTNSDIYMDNALRIDRIYDAIDAVVDPMSGQIVCRSTLMFPGNGCVPLNVFGVGAPSAEAIAFVTQDISQEQLVQQHVVDLAIQGEPFASWAGEVSVATGVSWREERFTQDVYPFELHELDMPAAGVQTGYRGLPAAYVGNSNIFERGPSTNPRGGYDVSEAFVEVLFPLLDEKPFARSLDLSAAYRHADYEGSGGVPSWKLGLDWQALTDLRLRVTRSRDVRAGSLSERFDTSRGPGNITDPFTGSNVPFPISVINGGNPEVDPEEADTLTYGLVYQPSWLQGFGITVDWFDIDVQGAIGQLGAQEIMDRCFDGAAAICALIDRDTSGQVILIRNLFVNTDEARTRGLDVEASYQRAIDLFGGNEQVSVRLLGTYLKDVSTTLAGASKIDRAGQTGQFGPTGGIPEYQASLNLGYERGGFAASIQERYIGSGVFNAEWVEGVDIDDNSVESALYTNLHLSYGTEIGGGDTTYEVWLAVSNLFDEPPAFAPNFGFTGSSHTNSNLFDIYGRRYNVGVRFNF